MDEHLEAMQAEMMRVNMEIDAEQERMRNHYRGKGLAHMPEWVLMMLGLTSEAQNENPGQGRD